MNKIMEASRISRREICKGLAVTTGLILGPSPTLGASGSVPADGLASLRRFMKIYASLASGTIWYWYSGTLELAPQDAAVTPLAGIETLIRRDVTAKPDGTFSVRTMEANFVCDPVDRRPFDSMTNPVTGRTIAPLHFSEGPRDTAWTPLSLNPRKSEQLTSVIELTEAGGNTWLKRELRSDFPHPLAMQEWPLETSGTRNRTGSFSTHCALTRDVQDPALVSAPCSFNYAAIFGWFPWLLMGQTPGHVLWRANGMKLGTLADLPGNARSGFDQKFPAIFAGTDFGPEGVDLWHRFKATRKPAPL